MKQNLLIVEENIAIRYLLGNVLGSKYNLKVYFDCYKAIAELGKVDVNLVIVNVDSVNSSNFDFLVHLHLSDFYTHIPVIVLSSNSSLEFKIKCLELRIEAFFLKPFDPLVLLETIDDVLFMSENLRRMKEDYYPETEKKRKLVG